MLFLRSAVFSQFESIVVGNVCCIDVTFLCYDMFVLSCVKVSFHKVTVRIAIRSSEDHGLVCLELILFSTFNINMVIWLSSLFNDSSSVWVNVLCWAMVNITLTFASNFRFVTFFSRIFFIKSNGYWTFRLELSVEGGWIFDYFVFHYLGIE